MPPKPAIVGHRGNARHAPENTRVSIVQAIEAGATIVEMDVRLSKDGQLVLMHDDTVDRTTNATGPVDQMTMQELSRLDAGSWKDTRHRGEPVPTLTQVADVCRGKAKMMLDLKCRGLGPHLARWIKARDFDLGQLILGPWEIDEAMALRRLMPNAAIVLICEQLPDDVGAWLHSLRNNGIGGLSIDHQLLTASLAQAVVRNKLTLYTWTVNELADLTRVCSGGVDGIITDDPAWARNVPELHS
jgi:glycerophosphoryl diester phosphodiesterase